ncbi:MAG: pyruvate ferredoxin oxidoreductase [Lachnospiraceae bacterium]|nr:pyruvate ferredoxin oxidoreductase [Lachnospiraceae bacterium]
MNIKDRMSGNEAVACALRQINPDVMPAFPITPSTEIPQFMTTFAANGQIDTEFIPVESEHSSLSAALGAEAAGARTVTATSSCGLAFMWEILYVAASDRLPLALACVNRALTGPININCDHADSMGARDSGWIQLYAETNQEAYDNMVMAFRIAEHKDVRLPIMVCMDGFITSHAVMNIEVLDDESVKNFVGEYRPEDYLLNSERPMAVGPYAVSSYYMEAKRAQAEALRNVKRVALEVAREYEQISGRHYGLYEAYRMEDAEYAVVLIGSAAGTAKDAVDKLRAEGKRVGLIKIRFFRPLPAKEITEELRGVKAVAVMDRCEGFSDNGGPLGAELMSAMFTGGLDAYAVNYIYGIGGRDVKVESIETVFAALEEIRAAGGTEETYRYLDLRQ